MSVMRRLPDFIIVGAMKAGTTSLHYILNHHNDVFIPNGEIYFFDIDDIQQHPDFFRDDRGQWTFHDYEYYRSNSLDWYFDFFQNASESQIIGEDSTTYMASSKAPRRIATLLPQVKLIFMLRDPVARSYSHYWHLVRTGRAIYDFEGTLRHTPGTILQRGCYKEQIERFKEYFPEQQLKFVLFERFTKNTQATVDEVCTFLGLRTTVNAATINTHYNIGVAPWSLRLKLRANRVNRQAAERRYQGYLPTSRKQPLKASSSKRFIEHMSPTRVFNKMVNFATKPNYPPIGDGVRLFLEALYAKENIGLSDLIGINIEQYWPYMSYHR